MANKDPAFLFYPSDFLTGTMLLSNEQIGKYIKLLCLQHQKGALSEKHMLQICETYDEDVFSKFKVDDKGKYYNERLLQETIKRRKYSESRSRNRLSKKDGLDIYQTYDNTYVKHMENENININKDLNKDLNTNKKKKFKEPTLEEVTKYCNERSNNIDPNKFIDFYQAKGWLIGKNKMVDWQASVRTWEQKEEKKLNHEGREIDDAINNINF